MVLDKYIPKRGYTTTGDKMMITKSVTEFDTFVTPDVSGLHVRLYTVGQDGSTAPCVSFCTHDGLTDSTPYGEKI